MAHSTCNGDPLIEGRCCQRHTRGSMDVVDAELLQRSGVTMVLYLKPFRTTADRVYRP
jgi:hypothetical protein